MKPNEKTKAWELYEQGVNYNNSLTPNQYSVVDTNTEFFIGNQWLHLPDTPAMRGLPKPTFNILKRVASLFIASLTSSGTTTQMNRNTTTAKVRKDASIHTGLRHFIRPLFFVFGK